MGLKKFSIFLFLYVGINLLVSCGGGQKVYVYNSANKSKDTIFFARGFNMKSFDDFIEIQVKNPWDSSKLLQKYILVDRNKQLPKSLPEGTIVRIPIKNAVIYTSVHTAILSQLSASSSIAGICESQYVNTPNVKQMISRGEIVDCGLSSSPNVEKIIDINAEIIIASPFENAGYGQAEKLGIPIFESADYMETGPLARAEWIRVFGILTGCRQKADSIFYETVKRYNYLKDITANVSNRPTVMAERKYGSSWFIPGGASYTAQMYKDAGADYIFADNNESGSVPTPFETVLEKGIHADYWLLKYTMDRPMTYSDLKAEYPPYQGFDSFNKKKIYTCNTTESSYYENISIHPDYILEDMIYIFHPELLPDYKPRFYFPMAQ